jgi:molybdopterin converting factor small subunit
MTFKIELQLYATLQAYAPVDAACYPVEAGTSIAEIVEALKIPRDQVKLIFSNGVKCEPATLVNQNDRIGIFPPVGGG